MATITYYWGIAEVSVLENGNNFLPMKGIQVLAYLETSIKPISDLKP